MTPLRLVFLAILTVAVMSCSNRDERERVTLLLNDDEETAAAETAPPPATEVAMARETTLILAGLMTSENGPGITAADQLALERTTQTTLETVPIGNESTWRNPQTGTHGVIAPRRTWQNANGNYCREFTQTYVNEAVTREAIGTACRESDGTWKLVEG